MEHDKLSVSFFQKIVKNKIGDVIGYEVRPTQKNQPQILLLKIDPSLKSSISVLFRLS